VADETNDDAKTEGSEGDLEGALGEDARCARLRTALREARKRLRLLESENEALREELLSAGEMIETLAIDLERATLD
jgi:multidrug resistance efflux pump